MHRMLLSSFIPAWTSNSLSRSCTSIGLMVLGIRNGDLLRQYHSHTHLNIHSVSFQVNFGPKWVQRNIIVLNFYTFLIFNHILVLTTICCMLLVCIVNQTIFLSIFWLYSCNVYFFTICLSNGRTFYVCHMTLNKIQNKVTCETRKNKNACLLEFFIVDELYMYECSPFILNTIQ